MGTLLALLSSVLWGTSDFLGGTASRRLPPLTVIAVSEAAGLVGVAVVAVATGSVGAPASYVGWSVTAGVVGLVGVAAFYRALATGTMGVVAPIAALGVVVPVIVGLVHGDRPGVVPDLGILVAVAGVVLASGPELQVAPGKRRAAVTPLLLAVVAAVSFGVVFVCIDRGARTSTVMTLVVMRAAAIATLSLVVVAVGRRRRSAVWRRPVVADLPVLVVIGGFDVGANAAFGVATRHGLLSLVSVLSSLYPAITTILARTVHDERLRRMQIGGVAAAVIGVALIASGGAA